MNINYETVENTYSARVQQGLFTSGTSCRVCVCARTDASVFGVCVCVCVCVCFLQTRPYVTLCCLCISEIIVSPSARPLTSPLLCDHSELRTTLFFSFFPSLLPSLPPSR